MTGLRCKHCSSENLRRSRRRGIERVLSLFGFLPFRCDDCGKRGLLLGVGPKNDLNLASDAPGETPSHE
jgi:DNA-directed RNA polymerase subunit RPC12/RpoP